MAYCLSLDRLLEARLRAASEAAGVSPGVLAGRLLRAAVAELALDAPPELPPPTPAAALHAERLRAAKERQRNEDLQVRAVVRATGNTYDPQVNYPLPMLYRDFKGDDSRPTSYDYAKFAKLLEKGGWRFVGKRGRDRLFAPPGGQSTGPFNWTEALARFAASDEELAPFYVPRFLAMILRPGVDPSPFDCALLAEVAFSLLEWRMDEAGRIWTF